MPSGYLAANLIVAGLQHITLDVWCRQHPGDNQSTDALRQDGPSQAVALQNARPILLQLTNPSLRLLANQYIRTSDLSAQRRQRASGLWMLDMRHAQVMLDATLKFFAPLVGASKTLALNWSDSCLDNAPYLWAAGYGPGGFGWAENLSLIHI